jgi:hyperpolarization activated cyclic nucleotide-gated potassium channel 1
LLIYPEDPIKMGWDLYIAAILVFSCLVTPYRIALFDVEPPGWMILNYFIDSSFFLDMIVIFNSAYYDEEFKMIQSRKIIALNYLKGWFTIDLFAIIPFDILFGGNDLNQIVRITRISKMYKLVKLTRLVRILKVFKESNKIFKLMESYINFGVGF